MSRIKVLIAGGGIGGLTLAHGLRTAGIECEVFERDTAAGSRSGYRLTLDADGGNALEACLPPPLYELYLRASHRTPARPDVSVVIDDQCRELTTAPHIGPPNDGERPHTAIDRRVFRQILSSGLDGVVHYEAAATGYTIAGDRVELALADGGRATGDVLVAADGVGSAIRRQLLPDVQIVPAPVGALGLFGRSPLTEEILEELPEVLSSAFVIARDDSGVMLSLGQCVPRQPVQQAAADVAPDVALDPSPGYMMLSGGIPPGTELPAPRDWNADTPGVMDEAMRAGVAEWHPAIRGLVDRVDPATLFSHPFRRLDPAPPWQTSRVTLVGDSIHAMLPTLGKGANMAMRNAAVLRDRLSEVDRGERELVHAIADYEADMRAATYPLMQLASDHGRFGGGGLRGPAPDGAPSAEEVRT
jgi:2-polyprenyl-6-methoxyphenol hydroxylase-like FAD-dependent oxidoreductase